MSINNETFESNGETFTRSDYNGVNIIIRNKDGYINATKIANDNGKRKRLPEYLKSDKWIEICETYKNGTIVDVQHENSEKVDPPENSVGYENSLFYTINSVGKCETYGTYVHPKLVHFVAEWCNISYAFKVATIMDNIDEIKTLRKHSGDYNLDRTIDDQLQEIKFLKGEVEAKDKKIEQLFKQLDEIKRINRKQTKKLNHLVDINEDIRSKVVGIKGRLTGQEVKDSKVLMMYTVKDEHNDMFIKIVRAQPTSLRGVSKVIYDKDEYLFLSYLPEAISQNKSVLNKLLAKTIYGGYITASDKGSTTKLCILANEYFEYTYGPQHKTFTPEKKARIINRYIKQFVVDYKRELEKQIIVELRQDDEN